MQLDWTSDDGAVRLYLGDSTETMRAMPEQSVQCIVTSPPYWGLRDYGVDGQMGLEPTPEEYVKRTVEWGRAVMIELNEEYAELAKRRVAPAVLAMRGGPLFAGVTDSTREEA